MAKLSDQMKRASQRAKLSPKTRRVTADEAGVMKPAGAIDRGVDAPGFGKSFIADEFNQASKKARKRAWRLLDKLAASREKSNDPA